VNCGLGYRIINEKSKEIIDYVLVLKKYFENIFE